MRTSRWAVVMLAICGCCACKMEAETLEPASGAYINICYENPDTGSENLDEFVNKTGFQPSGQMKFVDFTEIAELRHFLNRVSRYGGIAIVVALPQDGLSQLTAAQINAFAAVCAEYNAKGVGIIVRFGHEMNGDWNAWCMRPAQYRQKFQEFSQALDAAGAVNTAVAWTPNVAGNYPWSAYKNMTRATYLAGFGTQADWDLLDTNQDGKLGDAIGEKDDPYAPFYPGDQYVDWVGLSNYHFGNSWPWGGNQVAEDRKLEKTLKGEYNGLLGNESWVPSFYGIYAQAKNKPMMIAESSAAYFPDNPSGASEFSIKSNWIGQLFNITGPTPSAADISAEFPKLKCINWFHLLKYEDNDNNPSTPNVRFDWRVSENASVRTEWLARVHALKNGARYFLDGAGRVDDFESYFSTVGLQMAWTAVGTTGRITNRELRTDQTKYMLITANLGAAPYYDSLTKNLGNVNWSGYKLMRIRYRGEPGTSVEKLAIQLTDASTPGVYWTSAKWTYDNTGNWSVKTVNISECPFLNRVGQIKLVLEAATGGTTKVAIDGIRLSYESGVLDNFQHYSNVPSVPLSSVWQSEGRGPISSFALKEDSTRYMEISANLGAAPYFDAMVRSVYGTDLSVYKRLSVRYRGAPGSSTEKMQIILTRADQPWVEWKSGVWFFNGDGVWRTQTVDISPCTFLNNVGTVKIVLIGSAYSNARLCVDDLKF